MKVNTHNGLHIKKKLAPKDYRKSTTCRVKNPKSGLDITLPTEVIKMLRSGEAKFV